MKINQTVTSVITCTVYVLAHHQYTGLIVAAQARVFNLLIDTCHCLFPVYFCL